MNTSIKATRLNAISTFLSGVSILVFHKQLTNIFEATSSFPFLVVGGVIIFFSLTIFVEIKKQRALAILWIIVQDCLFTLGSLVALIIRPFDITDIGYLLIGLFLIPILFFIINQSIGLARIDSKVNSNTKLMSFKREIKGDKSKVWKIISDVSNYHKVAPNIDNVEIISGEGEGMIRNCTHKKDSWTERCSLWEDGKQYSFVVDTMAPDYPYPLKTLKGNWTVNKITNNETEIIMRFEFEYKKPIQNILVHPIMKHKFTKICKELLDNWQNVIE